MAMEWSKEKILCELMEEVKLSRGSVGQEQVRKNILKWPLKGRVDKGMIRVVHLLEERSVIGTWYLSGPYARW